MIYCPKCSIDYADDKKFCKNCGSPLVDRNPLAPPKEKTIGVIEAAGGIDKSPARNKKYCSACGKEYPPLKNFCKSCGCALTETAVVSPMNETDSGPIQRPQATQLSPLDIGKPQEETLNKYCPSCGAEQGVDQRYCKKCGFSLSVKTGYETFQQTTPKPSPVLKGTPSFNSSLYLKIGVVVVAISIIGAGGVFGYKYFFKKEGDANESLTQIGKAPTPTKQSSSIPAATSEGEIKKVFEAIKQANITKDINLFLSCYSTVFPNLEEKKEKTIRTWKDMDITSLNFMIRDLIAHQNITEVTIDWQITARSTDSGQTETFNTTNNVVLQKEGDQWKIVNLK